MVVPKHRRICWLKKEYALLTVSDYGLNWKTLTPNCTVNLRQIAAILVISRVSRQILRPCGVMMP